MALNKPRPINEQTLITREAKIAQPSEAIARPLGVNPSMVKVSGLNCWLIQATNSNSAPFITKEISPKVIMYSGIAMILITGAITAFIRPKIAPMTKRVAIRFSKSVPP